MHRNIVVSICCNTYNHEKYIAQTLESLICQKVDFYYEIIVHDDASTDKTQEIVKSYAEKHPNIIVPIFEKENQYSKGKDITRDLSLPIMKGKYLAFCEGDDFWTDENKLKKQVQIMEADDGISMCCHAHTRIKAKNEKLIDIQRASIKKEGFIGVEDCLSESNFPHLTSMLIRLKDYQVMPELFLGLPIGDYPLRAYALALGKIYYIDETMSSYRVMSVSSWSKKFRFDMEYRYKTNKKMSKFLREYDEYTKYEFHNYIEELIKIKDFKAAIFTGHYDEAKNSPLYEESGFARKVLIKIGIKMPKFAIMLGKIYSTIKGQIKA